MITVGQLYLHEQLNEYMVVTKVLRGQVYYGGKGFKGFSENITFLDRFKPVDPADVEPQEIVELLELCPRGTRASIGFIQED